jgi:arylsulfatase
MEFAYDGGGLGKGGTVTLYYDGDKAGEGRVQATQPLIFSTDETTDIGEDFGMPVSSDYGGSSRFNGKIDLVQIDIGEDNHDHLIDQEDLIRIAMSRQ